MQHKTNQNVPPSLLTEKFYVAVMQKYKIPILSGFFWGMATYMFVFTNKLVNPDEVSQLFGKGATLSSGRWGIDLLTFVFPNFSVPWLYGISTLFLVITGACITISIFDIKSKILQILLVGAIVSFPSLIGTFAYMFTSPVYGVSFLLAVSSVYYLKKNTRIGYAIGIILLVFSLSIYQSYISIATSYCLLLIIKGLLEKQKSIPTLAKNSFTYVFLLAFSLLLYYGLTQILFTFYRTGFNDYAAKNTSLTLSSIPSSVKIAYHTFWNMLLENQYGIIPIGWSQIAHFACLFFIILKAILWMRKQNVLPSIFFLLLLILFPLSVNCIFLFTDQNAIHTLVVYSFISFYILTIIILEGTSSNSYVPMHVYTKNMTEIALLVIIFTNVYVGNEVYLKMYLSYENTYAFYSSLMSQIKMTPSFSSETKLALIGDTTELIYPYEEFENINNITGANGISVNSYSRNNFIKYYLGFDIEFANDAEINEIVQTVDFINMDIYPYYGSIKKIGDFLVVKLGKLRI